MILTEELCAERKEVDSCLIFHLLHIHDLELHNSDNRKPPFGKESLSSCSPSHITSFRKENHCAKSVGVSTDVQVSSKCVFIFILLLFLCVTVYRCA